MPARVGLIVVVWVLAGCGAATAPAKLQGVDAHARDEHGNVTRSKTQGHIQIDTTHTLIVSDRMVVTIGVDNLVIVDTDDVLLVSESAEVVASLNVGALVLNGTLRGNG